MHIVDVPHGIFVNEIVVVAVFGCGKELFAEFPVALEVCIEGIANFGKCRSYVNEDDLLYCRKGIRNGTDAHSAGSVNGGILCSAVVDIKSASDAVVAEAGEEGLGKIPLIQGIVCVIEDGHVLCRTVCKLTLVPLHKFVHGLDGFYVAEIESHGSVSLAPSVIEHVIKILRRIESAVRPRRLHTRNEILDTAHHTVIAGVLVGVAVSFKCRNIHVIVHKCGVAKTRSDGFKAIV